MAAKKGEAKSYFKPFWYTGLVLGTIVAIKTGNIIAGLIVLGLCMVAAIVLLALSLR